VCCAGDVFSITPQACRCVVLSLSEQLVGPAGKWTSARSAKRGLRVGTKAAIDAFLVLRCLRFVVGCAFCLLKKLYLFGSLPFTTFLRGETFECIRINWNKTCRILDSTLLVVRSVSLESIREY
jgi:hypothetical protein